VLIGTPGRFFDVRMVSSVDTVVTWGASVMPMVSLSRCSLSRATIFNKKSPPPRIESTQTESLPLDADILGEMLSASDAQMGSLRSALAPLEKALRSEMIQNRRIRIAIEKAQRTARYAEADRIAAERRAERDRLEREGKGNW